MKLTWITKFVPILILSLGAVGLANAQTTPPPTAPPAQQTTAKPAHGMKAVTAILAKLNLSKDQQRQVKVLLKARREELKQYKDANPGADIVDKSGQKAENQKATATFMTGLKGVLTPTQWDQFETQYKATQVKKKKTAPVTPPPVNK